MLHGRPTLVQRTRFPILSFRTSPQDGFCIPNPLTLSVARIHITRVHNSFSARTVALTKSMTILTNPAKEG